MIWSSVQKLRLDQDFAEQLAAAGRAARASAALSCSTVI